MGSRGLPNTSAEYRGRRYPATKPSNHADRHGSTLRGRRILSGRHPSSVVRKTPPTSIPHRRITRRPVQSARRMPNARVSALRVSLLRQIDAQAGQSLGDCHWEMSRIEAAAPEYASQFMGRGDRGARLGSNLSIERPRVLLMHRLLGDSQHLGDRLPRPPLPPRASNLKLLEAGGQGLQ